MNEIWNSQLKESRLFAYESNIEFLHVTDLEIYNKILKNQSLSSLFDQDIYI